MDFENARAFADFFWEERIIPALSEYIRIPVLSRAFDPDWETNGHTDRALALVLDWLEGNRPEGTKVRVGKVPGRTPVLLVEIPGSSDDTVLGRKFPEAPWSIRSMPCSTLSSVSWTRSPVSKSERARSGSRPVAQVRSRGR